MQRRKFLKTLGVASGASLIPFLKYVPAEASGHSDTLVVVSGSCLLYTSDAADE